VAQIFRYRRHSTPVERQQTKWAVFGFTAAFTGFILFNLGTAEKLLCRFVVCSCPVG
jgi:hypothetical protein